MIINDGGKRNAAKRRVAQNVGLKEDISEFGKSIKRGKRNLQSKAEMGLFRLKNQKEMNDRTRMSKGSVKTEKKNPLKLPTKKPIPMRTQNYSNFPEMDRAARNLAISKYQGDRDMFTGKRPHKKRYF